MNTTASPIPSGLQHESIIYVDIFEEVIAWVIFCIGLPAVCLACYALYRLVKADHVAPLYVINLLLSDLVQVLARVFFMSERALHSDSDAFTTARKVFLVIVRFGLVASLGFMVCISLERYLVVGHPLWYRYHRNVKHTALVSLAIWTWAVIFAALDFHVLDDHVTFLIVLSTMFLLPGPFLLFFYVSTKKALGSAISVSPAEKRRIEGALALVLGIYAVLYLPFTSMSFFLAITRIRTFTVYCFMAVARNLVRLSPLVDPFLYIFMRKHARDTIEAFPCCRRVLGWRSQTSTQEETNTQLNETQLKSFSTD